MKLKIWNPYSLGISHMKFEQNRWQKIFLENFGKKFFVSDSAQTSCVKSLGHKDFKFWISSKSETKFFFFQRGDPLMFFKKSRFWKSEKRQRSPILMKLKIWNPYGLGISHMKFERNRRQIFFWHRRVPPLDFSELKRPKYPKTPGRPQLFIGPLDFTYP